MEAFFKTTTIKMSHGRTENDCFGASLFGLSKQRHDTMDFKLILSCIAQQRHEDELLSMKYCVCKGLPHLAACLTWAARTNTQAPRCKMHCHFDYICQINWCRNTFCGVVNNHQLCFTADSTTLLISDFWAIYIDLELWSCEFPLDLTTWRQSSHAAHRREWRRFQNMNKFQQTDRKNRFDMRCYRRFAFELGISMFWIWSRAPHVWVSSHSMSFRLWFVFIHFAYSPAYWWNT